MNLYEERVDDVLVVRIDEARLDTNVSAEFKTELLRLVETEGAKKMVVDLKQVQYADSSGLGALLFGHRHIKSQAGNLKLVHVNPKVRTLIQIAKMDKILETFDEEEKAIESFND